jgi:hypothetical protein
MRTNQEIDAFLDGKTEDAPDEIDAFLDGKEASEQESTGYAGAVGRGVAQGALGLAGGAGSAVKWLGDVSAGPYVAKAGEKLSKSMGELSQEVAPKGPDFEGTFVENPSVKRALHLIGTAAPSLGAAMATGMAATPLLGPTGGAIAGAGLLGTTEGAPYYEEARKAGKSVGEASKIGVATTVGTTLLEFLPISRFLKGIKGGVVVRGLKGGTMESTQEMSQQLWQNLVKKYGYDKTQGLAEGIVESGIAAFGTGAPVGVMFKEYDAADVKKARDDIDKQVVALADKISEDAKVEDEDADAFLDGATDKDPRQVALEKAWAKYVAESEAGEEPAPAVEDEQKKPIDQQAREANQKIIDEIPDENDADQKEKEVYTKAQAQVVGDMLAKGDIDVQVASKRLKQIEKENKKWQKETAEQPAEKATSPVADQTKKETEPAVSPKAKAKAVEETPKANQPESPSQPPVQAKAPEKATEVEQPTYAQFEDSPSGLRPYQVRAEINRLEKEQAGRLESLKNVKKLEEKAHKFGFPVDLMFNLISDNYEIDNKRLNKFKKYTKTEDFVNKEAKEKSRDKAATQKNITEQTPAASVPGGFKLHLYEPDPELGGPIRAIEDKDGSKLIENVDSLGNTYYGLEGRIDQMDRFVTIAPDGTIEFNEKAIQAIFKPKGKSVDKKAVDRRQASRNTKGILSGKGENGKKKKPAPQGKNVKGIVVDKTPTIQQIHTAVTRDAKDLPKLIKAYGPNFKKDYAKHVTDLYGEKGAKGYVEKVGIKSQKKETFAATVKSAKKANDVIAWIAGNSKNESYRAIAERILPYLGDDITFTVVESGVDVKGGVPPSLNIANGVYAEGKSGKRIYIKGKSFNENGHNEETILHEAIHAATLKRIKDGNLVKNKGTDLYRAVQSLYKLQNYVVKHLNSKKNKTEFEQKLTTSLNVSSVDELVANGLANKEFQQMLKDIKYPSGESVWSKFVSLMRRILGLRGGTAADELVRVFDEILSAEHVASKTTEEMSAGMVSVWHGSPHKVDKFATDKIGTGEGAQAFGWGLYFTDSEGIARYYADKLGRKSFDISRVTDKNISEYSENVLKSVIPNINDEVFSSESFNKFVKSVKGTFDFIKKENITSGALSYLEDAIPTRFEWLITDLEQAYAFDKKEYGKAIYDLSPKQKASLRVHGAKRFAKSLAKKIVKKSRNLYRVTLNKGKDDVWLDWDKPVPKDVAEKLIKKFETGELKLQEQLGTRKFVEGLRGIDVNARLKKRGFTIKNGKVYDNNGTEVPKKAIENQAKLWNSQSVYRDAGHFYRDLSHMLGSDRIASMELKDLGIDGIRYPTESLSGKKGSDKFNYVVFDESAIEIDEHIRYSLSDAINNGMAYVKPLTRIDRAKEAINPFLREFMHWIVDKNHAIQTIQNRLSKVTEDINLFLKETGRPKRTAAWIQRVWDDEVHPLITKMSKYKIKQDELNRYSHAMHVIGDNLNQDLLERNAKLRVEELIGALPDKDAKAVTEGTKGLKTPKEWFDALESILDEHGDKESVQLISEKWKDKSGWRPLSGLSDDEAKAILKKYSGNKKIEELRKMLSSMNNNRLETIFNAGLLPKEEYDAIKKKYKYYVPLMREGYDDKLFGIPRGLNPTGKQIKVRGGSTREVVNIFANSVANYERAIGAAEKAYSQKALYGLIRANPGNGVLTLSPIKKSKRFDSNGNLRMYPDMGAVQENEMRIMVGGKMYLITAENKTDRDAMLMMKTLKADEHSTGPIVNFLAKINRILARINTTWSPEFIVSNFVRDIQTAGINIQDTGVKGEKMFSGAKNAIQAIWAVERGKRKGTELEAMYDRFKKAGGKIGWSDVHGSIENLSKKISKEIKMQSGKAPARATIKKWLDLVENANTSIENGVRLHAFKLATEQGFSDERAAAIASDLTVDFTKKGAAGPVINSLYLFANAGIQGSYRILRAATKSRQVQKTLAGIVGVSFVVGLANSMAGEDEDGEDYYNKIDDFVRERNMIFMIPGTKGRYFKIPAPWGYNLFWNIGSELSRAVTKENYSAMAGAGRLMSVAAGAFNPVQSGTLLQTLSPTVADPFVQVSENKNWFGGDLMPAVNKFEKIPTPDSQRYWRSASVGSKWVAQTLNRISGGDKVKSGAIDVSPETLDLMLDTAGGSALRFFKDSFGVPLKAIRGEEVQMHKIPFARRVAGEQPEWANSRIYYDNVERVMIAKERVNTYKGTDRYKSVLDATKTERKLIPAAERSEKHLRRLRKTLKTAEARNDKVRVKNIKERMNKIYNQFNKKCNEEN